MAASLLGESVTVDVRYQVSAEDSSGNLKSYNDSLYSGTFTVGNGVEVQNAAISDTIYSSGYPQNLSGSISIDVSASSFAVSFNGTAQPGELIFTFTSLADQSASAVTGASETGSSGVMSGVNQTNAPTYTSTSATGGFFLYGFQPGTSISQNVALSLQSDITPPSVVSLTPNSAGPTNAATLAETITFSEAVTGVTADDFIVMTTSGNATAHIASVSGSGTTYTVALNQATGDGTVRLDLKASGTGITDTAGNSITGGFTGAQTALDHTAPIATSTAAATAANAAGETYAVHFSETVTGVGANDFVLAATGSAAGNVTAVTGSGQDYSVTVSGISGAGSLALALAGTPTVNDAAGNALTANGLTSSTAHTVDRVAPSATAIAPSTAGPTNATTLTETVTFSEAVSGVTADDFTVTTTSGTATAQIASVSGSGTTYTVTLNQVAGDGAVHLDLKAAGTGIADTAGNAIGGGFTGAPTALDHTAPTATSTAGTVAVNAASETYSVHFSEAVTGVGTNDFVLTATGDAAGSITAVTGSGQDYTITASGIYGNGSLALALAASPTVTDTATNALAATGLTSSTAHTVDRVAPSATAIVPSTTGPTNVTTLSETVTFSEAVTGVTADDFTVTTTSGDAAAHIASITPVGSAGTTFTVVLDQVTGDGTLRLDLNANGTGITDTGGNAITSGFTGAQTSLDHTPPSLTLSLSAGTGLDATHGNRPLITDVSANAQVLNAAEFADAFRLGGTASDANFNGQSGSVVTFTAADGHTVPTHSVPLTSDGNGAYRYAFRVDGPGTVNGVNADLTDALTDGTYTVQAATQDAVGNVTLTSQQTLIVDTTADAGTAASLSVDETADHVVNASEAHTLGFTVAGLDSDAAAVATFTDGTHTQMVQVAANGTGSVNLMGFDGAISSSLVITDIHQNTATATGNTIQADTTAPTLAVSSVSGATNLVDGHVVSGTIDTADAALAVTISNGPDVLGTAAVDAQGHFTFALPTDMADGTSHSYALTATAADAAGNLGVSDSFAFALDYTPNQSLFGAVTHDVSSPGGEAYALYDALLGRTPDATGLEGWASALGHGASLHDVSLGFLVSNEFTAKYGGAYTTGSDDAFVQYLYHEALGRAPDAQGEAGWDAILAAGGSRADVALKFALSAENQGQIAPALEAGVFVADPAASAVAHLYYGLLDRAPDAGGLQSYTAAVHDGLSLTSVAQNFLNSSEYASQHTGPLTDQQYVDSLYTHALGRTADAGSEAFWLNALSHNSTRADVAIGIAESREADLYLAGKVEAGWHLS